MNWQDCRIIGTGRPTLYRTRSPMTRLTPSRRRQWRGEDAVACGLALNDKHLIHSRVESGSYPPLSVP